MLQDALLKWKNGRDFLEALVEIGGFEPTCWTHADAEYVYHVTVNEWRPGKKEYKLEVQEGFDESKILRRKRYILAQDWEGEAKSIDVEKDEAEMRRIFPY